MRLFFCYVCLRLWVLVSTMLLCSTLKQTCLWVCTGTDTRSSSPWGQQEPQAFLKKVVQDKNVQRQYLLCRGPHSYKQVCSWVLVSQINADHFSIMHIDTESNLRCSWLGLACETSWEWVYSSAPHFAEAIANGKVNHKFEIHNFFYCKLQNITTANISGTFLYVQKMQLSSSESSPQLQQVKAITYTWCGISKHISAILENSVLNVFPLEQRNAAVNGGLF